MYLYVTCINFKCNMYLYVTCIYNYVLLSICWAWYLVYTIMMKYFIYY